jgi:tRNA (cytosine34-C5)-methyltransferase
METSHDDGIDDGYGYGYGYDDDDRAAGSHPPSRSSRSRSRSKTLVRAAKRRRAAACAHQDADARVHDGEHATTTTTTTTNEKNAIVLPRTSAPWFSRTLRVDEETPFEVYYKRQHIVREEEWAEFLRYLRTPLPVTFRMNRMASRREEVKQALDASRTFLQNARETRDDRGRVIPPPTRLAWCDGWQLGVDKMSLKFSRNPMLRDLQRWLVKTNNTGVLTRQAVDSMVPAAILQIEPHHRVLDLCASPGSKTTQALEALNANGAEGSASGCVIANDINPMRCYFLVRRCSALGNATANLMVTTHQAQWYPNVNVPVSDEVNAESGGRYPEGSYDRIICDVPCSGDGTLRKNPQIWSEWKPEFAMTLHKLQLHIAQRGAALLKVGGYMVYSTCSFNPVENEAVVAELIKRCGGAIEIVDASDRVPELLRRPGLSTWRVVTMVEGDVVEYPKYEDSQKPSVPIGLKRKFAKSMWPQEQEAPKDAPPPQSRVGVLGKRIMRGPSATSKSTGLEHCMRLVPHLQDMGGFFAVLLKKVAPIPGPKTATKNDKADAHSGYSRTAPKHSYSKVSIKLVKSLAKDFGLGEDFSKSIAKNLFSRSEQDKSVVYIADGVKDHCIDSIGAERMKCVWSGVKIWEKSERDNFYMLTQDGMQIIEPFITKRRVELSRSELKSVLNTLGREVPLETFAPATRDAIRALAPGSLVVSLKGGNRNLKLPIVINYTDNDALKLIWRYRKGLEQAPKVKIKSLLTALDGI